MTEAQFQARVIAYAELRGWLVSHVENVTMAGKGGRTVHRTPAARGFPDLVLARKGLVAFLEIKSETGQVSPEQLQWLAHLSGRGKPKPDQWRSRGAVPDGVAALAGSIVSLDAAGDYWTTLVALVRPRHWEWIMETLR